MTFAEPDASGRLNPRDIVGHLLLVWPTDYIENSPTKYSQPGKPSDVIVVDVVDLDDHDPMTNEPGYVTRGAWWRQGRLIGSLKKKIGTKDPMLARMNQGTGTPGYNAPFELVSATSDRQAVTKAQEWLSKNPDFRPTAAGIQDSYTQPVAAPYEAPATAAPISPAPPRAETHLERLARIAQEGAARLPKPPPEQIPF
jgi:hypothetical protein